MSEIRPCPRCGNHMQWVPQGDVISEQGKISETIAVPAGWACTECAHFEAADYDY